MAAQVILEYFSQVITGLGFGFVLKARIRPGLLVAFDYEGARITAEFIRVSDEEPGRVFAKGQRKAVEQLVSSKPDILISPHINGRLKELAIRAPDQAVSAVGADEQVRGFQLADAGDVVVKSKVYSKLAATIMQDIQKREPRNRGELIASDCDPLPFVDDVDVVPDLATGDDLAAGFGIAALEVRESLIRKDYSPAEGVVRSV